MRSHFRSTSAPSMYSAHAVPRSTSNLVIVFFATPVMRTVARMLLPSTSAATTAARFSVLRTFAILTIMLDRLGIRQGARLVRRPLDGMLNEWTGVMLERYDGRWKLWGPRSSAY